MEREEEEGEKGSLPRRRLFGTAGSWIGRQASGNSTNGDSKKRRHGNGQYLKLADKLPSILRFVPTAGKLRDIKNYLYLFCYFLQPTPRNIRSMILFALKHYVPDGRWRKLKIDIPAPEAMPSVAIYHPDAPKRSRRSRDTASGLEAKSRVKVQSPKSKELTLDAESTIGLLLMRPQVVSKTTKHYDALFTQSKTRV